MMLDFAALEAALAPLAKLGQGEVTVHAAGVPVTLAILSPQDEALVRDQQRRLFLDTQKQIQALKAAGEEDVESEVDLRDILGSIKKLTLSRAVVQIGDLDLRSQRQWTIPHPSGPRKVERGEAIQFLFDRMGISDVTTHFLFAQYSLFYEQVAQQVEASLEGFTPSDVPAEIARLEARIVKLREAAANTAHPPTPVGSEEAPVESEPVTPTPVPIPTPPSPEPPSVVVAPRIPLVPPTPPRRAAPEPVAPPGPLYDSFGTVEEEEQRLLQRHLNRVPPPPVVEPEPESDVPTFRLPSEVLSERHQAPPAPVLPADRPQSSNPRFRGGRTRG